MDEIVNSIKEAHRPVNNTDIAKLLESIGWPGIALDEKRTAVIELFKQVGGGISAQGVQVADILHTFEEY